MDRKTLEKYLSEYGVSFDDSMIENLEHLMKNTIKTNEFFNLTAIKDEETFREKMIFDSALGLLNIDLKNKKVIDVGTGAGFPGLVLYILKPSMDMTLLDSTQKKINYLSEYAKERNYHVNTVSARVEEYALNNRETYDVAYARAVSSLNVLLEMIVPLLKVGGTFVALKGREASEEIKASQSALNKLNCVITDVKEYTLPESHEVRNIIFIRKEKETNHKYPRRYSSIKKQPL